MNPDSQLIVAANRLPIRKITDPHSGETTWKTSPGGLTSALSPALSKARGVSWVGWPGDLGKEVVQPFVSDGVQLVPISLSAKQKSTHYDGMSNGTLWPLYHDKVKPAEFHRSWFIGYKEVNQLFADQIIAIAEPESTIWIHDYQLQLVPKLIREKRPDVRIGFFLHIPFPPPEIFAQLPWRNEIVQGILGSDLIGFHTPDDCYNFKRFIRNFEFLHPSLIHESSFEHEGRTISIKPFPIGIDFKKYTSAAQNEDVEKIATKLRKEMGNPKKVLLGVDRLDYTKGIDIRLRAFHELLEEEKFKPSEVTMIQVAAPSRIDVKAYGTVRSEVESLVGRINGTFSKVGLPAVHYIHRTQSLTELMALYRCADIMLVTPFRDGMNLVAMEYVAARYDNVGSLILSEFAGAAHLLNKAFLVNPYDIQGLKKTIMQAIKVNPTDAEETMKNLRTSVAGNDVSSWATSFLGAFPS